MKSVISVFIFFLFASLIYSQQDVKIISSDYNSITIEYTPIYSDTSLQKIENSDYRNVEIFLGYINSTDEPGSAAIPVRKLNIGVPSEFGSNIEILSTFYKEISGGIKPIPFIIPDSIAFSYDYKRSDSYFSSTIDENLVTFGSYGIARGVKSQSILVHPVQFDAFTNKIRLYSKILFRVNFPGTTTYKNLENDDLLQDALLNYSVAKNWVDKNLKLNKITAANSVLSNGKWVRFEAPEEGMYKITRANLPSFGIDPNTVDPRTIKIYNNGGKALPENLNASRPVDLVENAIIIVGEDDGKFDESDYIIFYGRGSSFWDYDSDGKTLKRFFNPYSNKNYFWITSGGSNGKRIETKNALNDQPDFVQTTSVSFASIEDDKINIGKSGRQFFGDDFSQSVTTRSYLNQLNGRVNSSLIDYKFRFIIGSQNGLQLTISENGNQVYSRNLAGYGGTSYTVGRAYEERFTYSGTIMDNRSALTIKVNPASITSVGYLDYIEIKFKKELKAFSDNIIFYSDTLNGIVEYALNGFSSSNIKVFDVTDPFNVKNINNFSLLSGGECRFRITESSNISTKFIAVGSDNFKQPSNPEEISNSNLRGEQQGAKFIIITHKSFNDAANTLKTYRESQAPVTISTLIADVDEIYNEFSCGSLDPTALRDYIKYAYDNWQIKPEYVLLFGKGTYDYKNVEGFNDNFVPTWQSVESLALINSYTTDDFFVRVDGADNVVDLAMGRLTPKNSVQANALVNKIIYYENSSERGIWRNLITLVADDGYTSTSYEGPEHTAPSERLSRVYFPASFDFNKIYSAAYPDVITGQGRRKPAVNQTILDAMNNGSLFINYIGHGSPELWAHEYIFEKSVVLPQLVNDKYFFMCAATCDFGYFDIPNYQSAAEEMMFLPNSGSIASFTASRLVYSGYNHLLNYAFVNSLFKSNRDTLNLSIPIGKASFLTKKDFDDINDQKYNIFGDPTLRLLVPQYFSVIDSVNSQVPESDIQVKALSKTKIDGKVIKPDSSSWSDFSGEGLLTFFDSERTVFLEQINYNVIVQGGVIFNGRVSINNGRFATDFVVPKDISYENRNGKIIFYFSNNSVDGIGYTDRVIVGGTDSTTQNDGNGPDIEIFFDNVNYSNAYLVGPDPKLIVKLADETGLNTTGTGVGHKLEGILNQKTDAPIDFTNYFTGDLDAGGRSGEVNYKFSSLQNGEYELQVKAWDVFNNFSTEKTFFSVVEGNDLVIRDVYNYPNPFSSSTAFTFQQNLDRPIDVKIKVYTVAGRLIREIEKQNLTERFVMIDWDGRDQDGDILGNGTYLYKLIVKTVDGEYNKSVLGKLAIVK